jgi:hypothetical protein
MTRTDTANGALTRSAGVCRERIRLRTSTSWLDVLWDNAHFAACADVPLRLLSQGRTGPGLPSRTLGPRYRVVGSSRSRRCSSVVSVWIARVSSVLVLSSSSCSLKS